MNRTVLSKYLLSLTVIIFIFTCNQPAADKEINHSDPGIINAKNNPTTITVSQKQFECGTSNLKYFSNILEQWQDCHPGQVKSISYYTRKNDALNFFDLIETHAIMLSGFDRSKLEQLQLPSKNDSMWIVIPVEQFCFISCHNSDSIPIKISMRIEDQKRFTIEFTSDSSMINKLAKIAFIEKTGLQRKS